MSNFLAALLVPPLSATGWLLLARSLGFAKGLRREQWLRIILGGWMSGSTWGLVAGAVTHDAWWASGSAISLVIAVSLWLNRKRRDRAKAWLGAKSRALRDALVARMPKPVVLRPGLGGAS